MNLGTVIRKKRSERGFSQEFLAEKLNISQGTLSNIESNKSKPDINLLQDISKILEIDVYDLMEEINLKQVNKDNSVGYMAEKQKIVVSEKLIEQYEFRLNEKNDIVTLLNEQNKYLKEEIRILREKLG
jgi:transcriptional regulator with XRE-family HTH domain